MIIPTVYPSLRDPEVYENPDEYNPDRYVTGDAEVKGAKNFLVFGTGPHYCLGQVYAQNNLALMIGKASMYLDWVHHPTPRSEEIKVFATIFPMVSEMQIITSQQLTYHRMIVLWHSRGELEVSDDGVWCKGWTYLTIPDRACLQIWRIFFLACIYK